MELKWNVYRHSFNEKEFEVFNVFHHASFRKSVEKYLKEKDLIKDKFEERIRREAMYYFWCKCEYEIVLKQWTGPDCEQKIDIFDQLQLNWDHFIDYLWRIYEGRNAK